MKLLTPLGLLGLIGIIVLIIIYILKPNYLQKRISSTFIWKLSLKYKKKRIPISKLRNLLLIICQMLIVTACAFALAGPIIDNNNVKDKVEKIIIIDASANMMTLDDTFTETRFERAIAQAKSLTNEVLESDGIVSVIVADSKAYSLVERSGADAKTQITAAMDDLELKNYGSADIDGAMDLAEKVLYENPKSEVILYTANQYIDKGNINVVDVSKDGEWNAAILNAYSSIEENLCVFTVEVACYNLPDRVKVILDVYGVNGSPKVSYTDLYQYVNLEDGEVKKVRFNSAFFYDFMDDNEVSPWVYSFQRADIRIETTDSDSFPYDNDFSLYGGETERIDVQYASTLSNPFFDAVFGALTLGMDTRWDIYVDTVKETKPQFNEFDFYLFEHEVELEFTPSDGVVFLVNPLLVPADLDGELQLGTARTLGEEVTLTKGEDHPITQYVYSEYISVRSYTPIVWYDEDKYTPLLYCQGEPVFLLKNEPDAKVMIFTGNLHMSDLAVKYAFPVMMANMFNYFFPSTLNQFVYDVGQTVTLNARSESIEVSDPLSQVKTYEVFPTEYVLPTTVKGSYSVEQVLMSGDIVTESFYAKIPKVESDINRTIDELKNPVYNDEQNKEEALTHLLIYFLAALVALMFIEWCLQSIENG
ncbi:MAG: BatA and WFA domain-containing protein [Clostridia bacterium]|nr:BatA and WFA domain-containing protein [Clostridia bacterium]